MFPISHFWEEFFQLFKKIFETLPFLLFVSSLGKEKIQEQREESFHVILRPVCWRGGVLNIQGVSERMIKVKCL